MDTKDMMAMESKKVHPQEISFYCGLNIRNIISNINEFNFDKIEEIRIRINNPLMAVTSYGDYFLNINGQFLENSRNSYIVNINDINQTLELMSENSLYAYQEEIKNGFLTLRGGHRVGIVGKVVFENNKIKTVKDISGINIRIARQVKGCADRIVPYITNVNTIYHTLIISAPNCGKTTLLRDVVRQISNGVDRTGFKGIKIGVVDERSEIAACYKGIPQNDIGIRTDVLDSCPKPEGILMLVRSMSPQVIATDELGTNDDIRAVEEALSAGVKIITTAHAGDITELSKKPGISKLFNDGLFERIIIINKENGVGTIGDIVDGTTFASLWRCKNVS